MQESDDRAHLRVAQGKGRHALLGAPLTNNGADLVTPYIFGDQFRPREVRPGLASRRIASMAESTLRRKLDLAGLNLLDRVSLRRQRFWRRLGGRALR